MGRNEPSNFHSLPATLALFGGSAREARTRLRAFMSEGLLSSAGRGALEPIDDRALLRGRAEDALGSKVPASLEPWLARVCGHFGVDTSALRGGSKLQALARARAVLAHLAVMRLGLEVKLVAAALGVSSSALSRAARRGAVIARLEAIDLAEPGGETSQQRPRSQPSQERPRSKL
jgi:hypothetical protein